MEKMPFEHVPEERKTPEPHKEKTGLSKFVGKIKTGIALGTAIAGIGMAEGSFEAQGAEVPHLPRTTEKSSHRLNDHERSEHFYAFTELYTKAISGFNKIKTPKDAEQTAVYMDGVVKFLKAFEWKRAGENSTLDKRFLTSLGKMEEMYKGLEVTFKVPFSGDRKAMFDGVRETFSHRLAETEALDDVRKAEKKLPKSETKHPNYRPRATGTGSSISFGNTSNGGGTIPRLAPSRSQPKKK